MKKIDLSIIIVNYKASQELFDCLDSIKKNIKGLNFEVVVVENEKGINLSKKIKKYDFVNYIRSPRNLGYGGGNNYGSRVAKGEYIFILNPDTQIVKGNIKDLLSKFNKRTGIVAPVLEDSNGKLFNLQGTKRLTPLSALFSTSILNKIWSNNPISFRYWMKGVSRSKDYEVDVVPGTAFIIRSDLFNKIGGFDDNFFLYFEEYDLCNRVKDQGMKIIMTPSLVVKHLWGVSTKRGNVDDRIFTRSRLYYFKKYYGKPVAYVTSFVLGINSIHILVFLIAAIGLFLRIDRPHLAMFIPDQGWFYISARDFILNGNIPLVGITSSHTWLHQGALWTYMLVPILLIFNYNPLGGFYLAAFFGVLSILLIYKIGNEFYSPKLGLVAAFLYAVAPLIVIHERMAYHTAPISFFSLLLIYSLLKWIKGSPLFFALSLVCMSFLYNLELATVVYWPVIIFLLLYGYLSKESWFKKILNRRIIIFSLLGLFIPMIPIFIYDINHGFPQTIKYIAWIFYSPISSLIKGHSSGNHEFVPFTSLHLARLVFIASQKLSFILTCAALTFIAVSALKKRMSFEGIIFLSLFFPMFGYIVSGTPSEAYLPMFFGSVILSISYLFYFLYTKNKLLGVFVILVGFVNAYLLFTNNYLMEKPLGYGWPIEKKEDIALDVIKLAGNNKYNLFFRNPGYKISESTQNYEYLIWWKKLQSPSKNPQSIKILITEAGDYISVEKINER